MVLASFHQRFSRVLSGHERTRTPGRPHRRDTEDIIQGDPQPGAPGADLALQLRHGGLDAAVRIERLVRIERRVGRAPAELGGPLGDDELIGAERVGGEAHLGARLLDRQAAGLTTLAHRGAHGTGHRGQRGGGAIDAVKDTLRPLLDHQPVEHREIVAVHEGHPVLAIADVNGGAGGAANRSTGLPLLLQKSARVHKP